MTRRAYIFLVVVCAIWFGARAVTQWAGFDFDEPAHVGTVMEVREFAGLAPADRFPEIIVNPQTVEPRFHMFPPLPYLVMAAATVVAQTDQQEVASVDFHGIHGKSIADAASIDSVATTVLLVSRALSSLMALVAVTSVGLAVRNLQRPESTWTVPAVVTVGMALMPGVHSLAASVTASTWALAAVGLTCATTAWAVRSNWSLQSTTAVVIAAVFVVAARASAYPVLLLVPLAMLSSRLTLRASVLRMGAIGLAIGAANGWWIVRNMLVNGDPLGANIYLSTVADVAICRIARESPVWCGAATGPWPAWTLLTSTEIFWVYLSRMLVRRTWIDSLTIVLWISMVVVPALLVIADRVRRGSRGAYGYFPRAYGGERCCYGHVGIRARGHVGRRNRLVHLFARHLHRAGASGRGRRRSSRPSQRSPSNPLPRLRPRLRRDSQRRIHARCPAKRLASPIAPCVASESAARRRKPYAPLAIDREIAQRTALSRLISVDEISSTVRISRPCSAPEVQLESRESMTDQEGLGFTFACVIEAPVDTVFTAITDQHAISTYFTDASSGPLATGATVLWRFGDLEIDVQVQEVIPNRRIVCNWPAAGKVDYRTTFTFTFHSHDDSTVIHVSETGWLRDDAGLASAFDQCSGWTHFFASLKARLEHNVDLKHFYSDVDEAPQTPLEH